MYSAVGNNFIASIEEKKIFGEISFFTGRKRGVYARAHNFVTLLYIDLKDFLESAKENKHDFY